MFPSDFIPSLNTSSYFTKSQIVARELLGNDMERDMDMVVEKFPFTNVAYTMAPRFCILAKRNERY